MKEPRNTTAEVITLNGASVSIKARKDDDDMNPSGWSIIVFAPSASIRCVRAHQPKHFNLFVWGILALAGETSLDPRKYRQVEETIHNVTNGAFRDERN